MDINSIETVSEDAGTDIIMQDSRKRPMRDENGEAIVFRVGGTYSESYRKAQRKVRDRSIAASRHNEEIGADDLDESQFELETAVIIAWPLTASGIALQITVENWRAVALKQPRWREQVQAAMNDHARFFTQS